MDYLILNLPSPPRLNVSREWAGTFGVGYPNKRESFGHNGQEIFQNWMAYAASAARFLNKEFEVVDGQAEDLNKRQLIKRVSELNPKTIITLISQPSYEGDRELILELKKNLPNTRIAVLGGIVNAIYKQVRSEVKADTFVRGYYPYFNETIEIIKQPKKKEICCGNDINPLDSLDFSVYESFRMDRYRIKDEGCVYFPLQNAVGCPYSCPYCPYPLAYGNKVFYKTVPKTIKEMKLLKEKYGFEGFLLRDVVFGMNKKLSKELLNQIIEEELGAKIFFETRADIVDDEFLQLAKKAGCVKIDYGLESGSERILKSIGKPGMTIQKLKDAIALTKKHGIIVNLHLIVGLVGEDESSIADTIKFIRETRPDDIDVNILTPYVGTKINDILKEKKLIVEQDWTKYTSFLPVVRTRKLSPRKLLRAKRRIERTFKSYKIFTDKKFRRAWIRRKLQIS
jgi:radical SAM superfamily enzyme YgiQ (UPF0313 family)